MDGRDVIRVNQSVIPDRKKGTLLLVQQVKSLELGFSDLIRHRIEFKGGDIGSEEGANIGGEVDKDDEQREHKGEEITFVEGELGTTSHLWFEPFDIETGSCGVVLIG